MRGEIVIVGGGIMGCSTAYWISQLAPHQHITIMEMDGIASSSSGKAGGFLARGWHGGGTMQQLHEVGFDLIEEFATKHKLPSYRKVPMYSLSHRGSACKDLPWLDNAEVTYSLDDPATAQITPKELTEAFLKHAGPNVTTRIGVKVTGVEMSDTDNKVVKGVTIVDLKSNTTMKVDCEALIVCTGAWAGLTSSWFPREQLTVPRINMGGIKSSSLVYHADPPQDDARRKEVNDKLLQHPAVLFCEDDRNGCHLEVYPRPNGDVYLCGLGGSPQLSADQIENMLPRDVLPNENRVELAHQGFMKMTSQDASKGRLPDFKTACLRPIMPDGLPVMGPLMNSSGEELKNVFVNAGHNCWGILWSGVSGKVIAELVVEGEGKCMCLKPFHPKRLLNKNR